MALPHILSPCSLSASVRTDVFNSNTTHNINLMQEESHSNQHLSKVFTHHQHSKSFHTAGNYKSTHHVRCIFCNGHVWTILAFIFVKYKQNVQCSSLASHTTLSHTHTQTPAEKSMHSLWESSLSHLLTQMNPAGQTLNSSLASQAVPHTNCSQQDRLNNLSLHQAGQTE